MILRIILLLCIISEFVQSEEYQGNPFDYNMGITIDSLFISDSGTISDVNLQISLAGRLSQIRVLLISPYGTPVTLWDHGLAGTILYQTVFDDSSNTLITAGSPPYIGSHQPIEELSQLNGESVTGYWQLMVYLDNNDSPGSITSWSLYIITNESLTIENTKPILPVDISLKQNYPNPFNPSTKIEFNNPYNSLVSLTVYDLTGRKVQALLNQKQVNGKYSIIWDGSDIPSGVYFITLTSEGYMQTRKAVLLK